MEALTDAYTLEFLLRAPALAPIGISIEMLRGRVKCTIRFPSNSLTREPPADRLRILFRGLVQVQIGGDVT